MFTPRRVARPHLEALAQEIGETVFLGLLVQDHPALHWPGKSLIGVSSDIRAGPISAGFGRDLQNDTTRGGRSCAAAGTLCHRAPGVRCQHGGMDP
jgi:hypothetical protein